MISEKFFPQRRAAIPAILGASPFILLAIWNLWEPYSYWYDELFSMVASSKTWLNLIRTLLGDVHPPLYQIILKIWIDGFGSGEVQARVLSVLFALSALGIFIFALRTRRALFLSSATMFFVTTWLFAFYAQEVRGYALLLLLATAASLLNLNRSKSGKGRSKLLYYGVLTALSLTHYFGLIFSGVLLLGDVVRVSGHREKLELIGVGAFLLAWPILHLSIGTLGNFTGGHHWLTSEGIHTTFLMFLKAVLAAPIILSIKLLPFLGKAMDAILAALAFVVLLLIIVRSLLKAPVLSRQEMLWQIVRIGGFLVVVAAIDLHTPISFPRYYIVLLPSVSILFGQVVQVWWEGCSHAWQRSLLGFCLLAYLGGSTVNTCAMMLARWGPRQNWRELVQVVNRDGICSPHCWFLAGVSEPEFYQYYFESNMGGDPQGTTLSLEEIPEMSGNNQLPIIAANADSTDVGKLLDRYPDWYCLEPQQSWPKSVVMLVPDQDIPKGLKRCR